MRNVSIMIEQYLKNLLQNSLNGTIEIQRNELAENFMCVPSQINYVLSTRFTFEKGYLVESKRGGGGYVRIQRIELPSYRHIIQVIGESIDQITAEGLISQLEEASIIQQREAHIMRAAISRNILIAALPLRDEMRSRILRSMLMALLSES